MSGVIDKDGQQWERCNCCGKFVKIETLRYEVPSTEYKYGRDLCKRCAEGNPPAKKIEIFTNKDGMLDSRLVGEDRLSYAEEQAISKQVREDVEKYGLKVRTMNPDGSWTNEDIPPKGGE